MFRLETNGIVADYLIDTDIFIDHLRGARTFDPKSHRVHYSVVTRAELFAGSRGSDAVRTVLSPFREVEIDRAIAERAGRVRRETGIRLPDALIAATAVERKLSLFTRNRSDFEKVRGLRIREI
jgi:predicted nucleic acid-binding protein